MSFDMVVDLLNDIENCLGLAMKLHQNDQIPKEYYDSIKIHLVNATDTIDILVENN